MTTLTSGTTQQGLVCALYGWDGADAANAVGFEDVQRIVVENSDLDNNYSKFVFGSAVMDITANNVGVNKLEVDVYEIVAVGHNMKNNYWDDYAFVQSNQPVISGGTGTAITINTRGATPFDFPNLAKYWKIMKKTKFLVNGDESFTYQMRLSRNKWINTIALSEDTNVGARKGWTRALLFIIKNTDVEAESTGQLTVGVTRKYTYKVLQENFTAAEVIQLGSGFLTVPNRW